MIAELNEPTTPYGNDTQAAQLARWAAEEGITPAPRNAALEARPLSALQTHPKDDPDELIRGRYLCRGSAMLFVGPTGIGKSSFLMQVCVSLALGREAFGLAPTRPLKVLLIQAENDDGDLAEMRDGVRMGLGLSNEEAAAAFANVIVARDYSSSGPVFIERLKALLAEHKPDLVCIDPALAYIGGEAGAQAVVGQFLRNGLNPLLHEYGCGCIIVHHTNKPPNGVEKSNWQAGDFAYAGSGSGEWANWARAVLVLRSIGSHHQFELRAAKRGERLDWKDEAGNKTRVKHVAHASEPGIIYWRELGPDELAADANPRRPRTKEDVLIHVPPNEAISKEVLRNRANAAGVAFNKINGMIKELLQDGALFEWKIRRPGARPEIWYARRPQDDPEFDLGGVSQ